MAGDKLLSDFVGQIARNRETEAAVQPVDEGVHAHHLAVDIAERAAAIARVDRRIGLQVIRDRVAARREQFAPAFSADHAVGECVIELERRADGEGKLPHAHRVAVRELGHRQIRRLNLDDRDIRFFIGAHDFRLKLAAILELHIDAVGALPAHDSSYRCSRRPAR